MADRLQIIINLLWCWVDSLVSLYRGLPRLPRVDQCSIMLGRLRAFRKEGTVSSKSVQVEKFFEEDCASFYSEDCVDRVE